MPVSAETFVYIIASVKDGKASAPVKVGISNAVGGRVATIATSTPFEIKLSWSFGYPSREIARHIERCFHEVMAEHRLHGEWFDLPPERALFSLYLATGTFLSSSLGMDAEEVNHSLEVMGFINAAQDARK